MSNFENTNKVVQSAPAKKLSEWFISNENTCEYGENIWCFDQYSAINTLNDLQIQRNSDDFILEPIKI